jgi:hypothetical protein
MNSPWTETVKAELLSLTQAQPPITYDAIAERLNEKFGTTFTKNACIGRSRRLAVSKQRAEGTGVYERKKKIRTKAEWHPALQDDKRTFDCRQITELDNTDCHWPINDGKPFLFCGRHTAVAPYCATHTKLAYPAAGRH